MNSADSSPVYSIFFNNAAGFLVGSITNNGSSTAYNTSSDYRLKEDAQLMSGASDRVLALKPVNFEWISSGERVDGFLAHEACRSCSRGSALAPKTQCVTKNMKSQQQS
jgi:hypothetical protein